MIFPDSQGDDLTKRCTICLNPAVWVWSYQENRGEMLPSSINDLESDTVPHELCCVDCARNRHSVDFDYLLRQPN